MLDCRMLEPDCDRDVGAVFASLVANAENVFAESDLVDPACDTDFPVVLGLSDGEVVLAFDVDEGFVACVDTAFSVLGLEELDFNDGGDEEDVVAFEGEDSLVVCVRSVLLDVVVGVSLVGLIVLELEVNTWFVVLGETVTLEDVFEVTGVEDLDVAVDWDVLLPACML